MIYTVSRVVTQLFSCPINYTWLSLVTRNASRTYAYTVTRSTWTYYWWLSTYTCSWVFLTIRLTRPRPICPIIAPQAFGPPVRGSFLFVALKRFLALHLSFGGNLTREILVSGERTLSAVKHSSKYWSGNWRWVQYGSCNVLVRREWAGFKPLA